MWMMINEVNVMIVMVFIMVVLVVVFFMVVDWGLSMIVKFLLNFGG